ncbi:MAG: hypothetical protein HQL53_08970 [Magnetococcales bacterium]|nr:hypothetical protein [Magnetococcales bacterium]
MASTNSSDADQKPTESNKASMTLRNIPDDTRAAVHDAAKKAGTPVYAWAEQALRERAVFDLEGGPAPTERRPEEAHAIPSAGDNALLDAVRQELGSVRQALEHLERAVQLNRENQDRSRQVEQARHEQIQAEMTELRKNLQSALDQESEGGLSRDGVIRLVESMVQKSVKERMSRQLRDFESLLIWSR